jgi:hypothetical protein
VTGGRASPLDAETLAGWLIERQVLPRERLDRARMRQRLYGGGLDTALLELGSTDEATLSRCLCEAAGLEPPRPEWLAPDGGNAAGGDLLDATTARKLGGQPVAEDADQVVVVARPGADVDGLYAWAARHNRGLRVHPIPEVRLEALWATLHGTPLAARYASLLGRLSASPVSASVHAMAARATARELPRPPVETGPAATRDAGVGAGAPGSASAMQAARPPLRTGVHGPAPAAAPARFAARPASPAPAPVTPPPANRAETQPESQPESQSESQPESIDRLLDALYAQPLGSPEHATTLRRLRRFAGDARVGRLMAVWRSLAGEGGPDAPQAIAALAELRDEGAVPLFIDLLADEEQVLRDAAFEALRTITRHDFGPTRWRWSRWWREAGERHRVQWLLDALEGKDPELRLHAAQELEQLSGRYVGYHFDLGKRDRDEARRRWQEWWNEIEAKKPL